MGNWNLSVDIRGTGHGLARELRQSATHARSLGQEARQARLHVRQLGAAAQSAGRHIRTLGREARSAGRDLNRLGSGARSAARQLNRYGDAARTANRHVNSLGDHSRTAGRDLARMSGQIDGAVRDLLRLAQAAQRASTHMHGLGDNGARAMRRYADETGRLRHQLVGAAALLSGGGLVMGFGELIKNGNEYQQAMNTFGAVTGATQMQMQRAAGTASQLGNDLSIPGASATEAAEAMVELAKAGFRTDQAISSTKSALILASAAQVNAADSAKYLGDMMDQFGMGADQASVAADTLAATANAASGDIIDIYYAMKYAGPVAHGLGVTMQEAATGVGMLGKAGILGQTAGTTMRGIFTNLSKPTKQMTQGLNAMGIEAYDAQGKFKGLRYVVEKLQAAEHKMSQKDFTANVAKAFGKPAMSGAIALAHQGTDSYDALIKAVSETGAASDIAAAKGKGLAGAMLQLKTQAKQTGLTIYNGMAPGLEFITRGITSALSDATPKIEKFFQYFNDVATLFGPGIAAAAKREFGSIGDSIGDMAAGFKDFGVDALAASLHVIMSLGHMVVEVLKNLKDGAEPIVGAFADIASSSDGAATAMDTVVVAIDMASSAVEILSGVLGPLGHMVGGLVSGFSALPGPIQTAVFAMLLMRRVGPLAQGLAGTVGGRLTGAYQSLNQQMAVQRTLAATAGQSLTRYGAAFAVLQARVPVISRMADSFRTAQAATTGFAGSLRGATTAAATGLRASMSGLMGVMGGPWGLALTGITVGLGMLASSQQKAAAKAAEHKANIDGLTSAMRQSNGVIDQQVRQQAAQNIQNTKLKGSHTDLLSVMAKEGYTLSDLTDSYLGQGESVSDLADKMMALSDAEAKSAFERGHGHRDTKALMGKANAYASAAMALRGMAGDAKTAAKNAKDLNSATKGTGDGVSAYQRLKGAVEALADKTADADTRTRALRVALDLLSGGSVSLQAAQARVNEAITNANEAMAAGIDQTDGWGKALLNVNGSLSTTTKNGQQLFNTLNTIADGSASAAIAAYDFAISQKKGVPEAVAAARGEMEKARASAIKLSAGYGLSAEQAGKVADSMGLIPGQVSILLQTKGVDTALAELLAVQAEFARMPKAKTIKVDALGAEAKKELEAIGYQIELIPGTREYKITAPTAGARQELDLLIAKLGQTNGKTIVVDAATDAAISDLETLKSKVASAKGKTITMSVPTSEGRRQLELLGYKIQSTKGKTVVISVPTGDQASRIAALQRAIDSLSGKSINITTHYQTTGSPYAPSGGRANREADGGVLSFYADGGMNSRSEQHVAQIAPRGSWRVWAEDETDGESYIPLAQSKRPRSRAIAEETVRRLGGDPAAIQWNADGGVTDWRYDPNTGSLYSPSDAGSAAHKTKKVKGKEINYFDLGALEKKLKSTSDMTRRWNADLAKVADRVGGDVAEALAAMGTDGYALTKKMATGSTKYINQMAAALRGLAATAKASLTDYTRQLTKATAVDSKFAANLAKLAAQGYGDLAKQLAAQGDETAQQLAASAVSNSKQAASANKAAKNANNALTSEQVQQLVAIIAAVKTSKTGLHDVADATGLGEDEIIATASKATGQIKNSLGDRATKFLADLSRASKGLSYANGGIRPGIYSTRGGAVTFAEPETGGEGYIPLGANKRRQAMPVLRDIARRFGVGLTDLSARQVVVVKEGGDTHVTVTAVRPGSSDTDIAFQVGRSVRRVHRGGVNARAAA